MKGQTTPKYILALWLIGLLTACGQSAATPTRTDTLVPTSTPRPPTASLAPATSPAPTATPLPTPSPTQTPTNTLRPSATPTATPTPTPTPYPTLTPIPTFTPAPRLRTPAPPAECPEGGAPAVFGVQELYGSLADPIQGYLNTGGTAAGLQALLDGLVVETEPPSHIQSHVLETDVTGDGTPEVIVDVTLPEGGGYASTAVMAFTCQAGRYERPLFLLLSPQEGLYPDGGYRVQAVEDMNGDGVRDVVLVLTVGSVRYVYILEWNGAEFGSLIEPWFEPMTMRLVYYLEVWQGRGRAVDTDGDGLLEWVVTYELRSYDSNPTGGPQRVRQDIWAWDGYAFRLACSQTNAPPVYRFQAVQDGDDASLCSDYERALAFYRQVISDDQLLGWSPGQLLPDSAYGGGATPTPDPDERQRLSAYAGYRTMLVYLVQGLLPEAESAYATLRVEFPPGSAGWPYVELATVLWEAYAAQEEIGPACDAAIEYAMDHYEAILEPLNFYGSFNRDYNPADICPFD